MPLAVDVVKQGKKRLTESFDPGKLYASIYATCTSASGLDGLADDLSRRVCDIVVVWCQDKPEVTSSDIRHKAAKVLHSFHPDAAYLYKHYKKII